MKLTALANGDMISDLPTGAYSNETVKNIYRMKKVNPLLYILGNCRVYVISYLPFPFWLSQPQPLLKLGMIFVVTWSWGMYNIYLPHSYNLKQPCHHNEHFNTLSIFFHFNLDGLFSNVLRRNPRITISSFNRPNLYFAVSCKNNSTKSEEIYRNITLAMERCAVGFRFPGPTIIYCPSKSRTDDIAEVLRSEICFRVYSGNLLKSFTFWFFRKKYQMWSLPRWTEFTRTDWSAWKILTRSVGCGGRDCCFWHGYR